MIGKDRHESGKISVLKILFVNVERVFLAINVAFI